MIELAGEDMDNKVSADLLEERVKAQTNKLNKEAEFFAAQTRKEEQLTRQHELAALEAQRIHNHAMATNSENRVYDFIGSVSPVQVENALQTLSRWRRLSSDPITIRISSPGGSVTDGLALYDYLLSIRAEGIKVTTVCLGMAASMASILLQAGEERIVGPNAHVLIHEVSSETMGKLSEIEDETKFLKGLNDRLYAILADRSKMTKAEISRRAARKDWWLSAEECVKLGIADRIGHA